MNKTMVKARINIDALPHNFQLVQVGSLPYTYIVGGGDFNSAQMPQSMFMIRQVNFNNGTLNL